MGAQKPVRSDDLIPVRANRQREIDVSQAIFDAFLDRFRAFVSSLEPAKLALFGYLSYVLVGWLTLSLPFSQTDAGVSALDNLFIATSAVSTTGLVTVSISQNYSLFGQIAVLILIQLGGIGYMTFGSFVVLSRKSTLTDLRKDIGKTVFSMPESFRIDKFLKSVVSFTLVIEFAGTVALYLAFRNRGIDNCLWSAIFHSVSAFCTAGFSLYDSSFENFSGDFWINVIIAGLSYLGAIGFIVCVDFWRMLRGKIETVTLTSKIILWATAWLTIGGTILIFLGEASIQAKPADERLLAAFFQTMTAMTTVGFNTIGIGSLTKATLLLVIVLMIIGASPSGTGGGLKSTTFSAIVGVMRNAIRGKHDVSFWGKPIPIERVLSAVASLGFYLLTLSLGTYLLQLTEPSGFEKNLFEAASALGTVGLSMGITSSLTNLGKLTIILLMFCGRLGPLTFGMALFFKRGILRKTSDTDLAV